MSFLNPEAPLRRHYTEVDGLSICSRVATPGPDALAIVLVHGLGVSGRYLVPLAKALAAQYRVFVPDMPGYGSSDRPDHVLEVPELAQFLDHWLDTVGLEQAVFLGNSFGCQVIAELALRYPHRIDRAILLGPTSDRTIRSVSQHLWRFFCDAPNERLSLSIVLAQEYLRAGMGRFIRNFQMVLDDHIETKLPHMQMPTLVVRGSRDPLVSQLWVEEVTNLLPYGQLAVLPKAGHVPNYSDPAGLARLIDPFLKASPLTLSCQKSSAPGEQRSESANSKS
ncbi:MAG TPA: alpha/beta hydrolase [Trichocoleus sp.]